jgi:hypothetical protein
MRTKAVLRALSVGLALALGSGGATAFQPTTQVAVASRAQSQLASVITLDDSANTLRFTVRGENIDVGISAKAAYRAVVRWPQFFRAGAIGPDAFPDPITGLFVFHENEAPLLRQVIGLATPELELTDHATSAAFEQRRGPSEWRSIDFATRLLAFWKTWSPVVVGPDEREQALAFIMGYFAHTSTDGFSREWSNHFIGGAWNLRAGADFTILNQLTEELQRLAVETMIDRKLPADLLHGSVAASDFALLDIRAPAQFLSDFFRAEVPNPIPFGQREGSIQDYLNFYRHLDRFQGSVVYNYLNAQAEITDKIESFTDYVPAFNYIESTLSLGPLETLIRSGNWAGDMAGDLNNWIIDTGGGPIGEFVAEKIANCTVVAEPGQSPVDALLTILNYITEFHGRLASFDRKAEAARRNWTRLAECTAQNLAWIERGNFDPATLTNRDACAIMADAPSFADGNPQGLFVGSAGAVYEQRLRNAFRGADDDLDGTVSPNEFYEPLNRHRSFPQNVRRMISYLTTAGLTIPEIDDALLSEDLRDNFRAMCANARSQVGSVCLNEFLRPLFVTFETAKCAVEVTQCVTNGIASCLTGLCKSACAAPGCSELCDLGRNACRDACDGKFCLPKPPCPCVPTPCPELPPICCIDPPEELCPPKPPCLPDIVPDFGLCTSACDFLLGGDPRCAESIVKETFNCTLEAFGCGVDILAEQFSTKNYSEKLLQPVRQFCDQVEPMLELWQPLKTPEGRVAFIEGRLGVPLRDINDNINLWLGIYDQIIAFSRQLPPEYLVFIAFLREDIQGGGVQYIQSLRAAIGQRLAQAAQLTGQPRLDREDALRRLVQVVDALEARVIPPAHTPRTIADIFRLNVVPDVLQFAPSAIRIRSDIGLDFATTFDPFFNAVHGAKIAPLTGRSDVEALFDARGVDKQLLPWLQTANLYSAHCSADGPLSMFCDVTPSLHDPNCIDCPDADLLPDPARANWVAGRGITPFNRRDPVPPALDHILTNLPYAATETAYQRLYTKIFRIPDGRPRLSGFEDPARPWTSGRGGIILSPDAKDGAFSLEIDNCNGRMQLDSPLFRTTEWGQVGDRFELDVLMPPPPPQSWQGRIEIYVDIPDAGMNGAFAGAQEMRDLPLGVWSTARFAIPAAVQQAFLEDHPNARIHIVFDPPCEGRMRVDNLRFAGNLRSR